MRKNKYLTKTRFVAKLGLSLHTCGATSHRIERHLSQVCELLGIHGEFLYSQTSFTFVFWKHDPTDQQILIRRTRPSEGNLGLLVMLDELIDRFSNKQLTFKQMSAGLDKTLQQPNYYNTIFQSLGWLTSGFAFSTLLSPSFHDAIAAGIASFIIYYLVHFCSKYPRFDNLHEILGATASGLIISFIAFCGWTLNIPFCLLASIIIMIPGLSTTVALSEIAQRDLIAGSSRLVDALMSFAKLYLGALLGLGLSTFLMGDLEIDTLHKIHNIPEWATFPAVILLSYCITIAFNIHPKFILWCILSSLVAFIISAYSTQYLNQTTAMLLGAASVGIFSNTFANIVKRPASLVLTTGIIFLVPGSKTYMLLNSWVTGKQMVENTPNAIQAFLIFISLVGGLLLSNAIVPTKKSL